MTTATKAKPRLLFMHVEPDREAAARAVEAYQTDRRNVGGKWHCRKYPRIVRADGLALRVWVVVIRERVA